MVTLYEGNALVFFDAVSGMVTKKLPVSAEPYGIVADPEGRMAWVTHEYPGTVSTIDLQKEVVAHETQAGSHLRGIALSPDGKRVYVSEFYTGMLLAFDIFQQQVVDSWQGRASDNLSRHVLLHPTRSKAYLPHIRSIVGSNHGAGTIFPQLSICDLKSGAGNRRTSFAMDTFNGVYVTTNPWEAAISSDGKRLYVIYAGTDDMNVCNVIDDDYREIERTRSAFSNRSQSQGDSSQPRQQTRLHLQCPGLRGGCASGGHHATFGHDQGLRAVGDARLGARQDLFQQCQTADE